MIPSLQLASRSPPPPLPPLSPEITTQNTPEWRCAAGVSLASCANHQVKTGLQVDWTGEEAEKGEWCSFYTVRASSGGGFHHFSSTIASFNVIPCVEA